MALVVLPTGDEISPGFFAPTSIGPRRMHILSTSSDLEASASIAALPYQRGCLIIRFLFVASDLHLRPLQIPPRGGHPGFGERFLSLGSVGDFHSLLVRPTGRTSSRWGPCGPRPLTPPDILIVSGGSFTL